MKIEDLKISMNGVYSFRSTEDEFQIDWSPPFRLKAFDEVGGCFVFNNSIQTVSGHVEIGSSSYEYLKDLWSKNSVHSVDVEIKIR